MYTPNKVSDKITKSWCSSLFFPIPRFINNLNHGVIFFFPNPTFFTSKDLEKYHFISQCMYFLKNCTSMLVKL